MGDNNNDISLFTAPNLENQGDNGSGLDGSDMTGSIKDSSDVVGGVDVMKCRRCIICLGTALLFNITSLLYWK